MSFSEAPGLNARLRALVERYAVVAQQVLGENLTSVVLFGSVARGEARPGSDIDLLVVCQWLPGGLFPRQDYLAPVREQLQPELESLWEQGVLTDFVEITKTEAEAQHTFPLYLDLTAVGLALKGALWWAGLEVPRVHEVGIVIHDPGALALWQSGSAVLYGDHFT